jgi:proline dehydrogenase
MLRRTWQATMIALARSPRLTRIVQSNRATSFLASKYVAGKSASDAVSRACTLLSAHRIRSSLFYLGEYVDHPDLVAENVSNKVAVARALQATELDVHVSIDPTQIGYAIEPAMASANARRIAEEIKAACGSRPGIHCLMFDMEDASIIDATIALHDELRLCALPVALTLQAYLRRTTADLSAQIERGSRVRLVKGAFAAGADIAFTRQGDIKENYRRLIDMMFSPLALASGFYPILATHDDRLQAFALGVARKNGWERGRYEFEMLMGVRPDVAAGLAQQGETVRLYVPFGMDWWPYAVRRIGENPRNALLLARSLIN